MVFRSHLPDLLNEEGGELSDELPGAESVKETRRSG